MEVWIKLIQKEHLSDTLTVLKSNRPLTTKFRWCCKGVKITIFWSKEHLSEKTAEGIRSVTNKISKINAEISYLKRADMRNNIVIFNLEENQQTDTNLISTIASVFLKLNIIIPDLAIADAFRLGKDNKENIPILIKFIASGWVRAIFEKVKDFHDVGLSVANDRTPEDRECRKKLLSYAKIIKEQ